MRNKMVVWFALISAILFISLATVVAETTSQTNMSLMEGQNATLNQTMNETRNQTLNESIKQTTNMTPDLANTFQKVKGGTLPIEDVR
jgi:Flp pilus assembly protein TadD